MRPSCTPARCRCLALRSAAARGSAGSTRWRPKGGERYRWSRIRRRIAGDIKIYPSRVGTPLRHSHLARAWNAPACSLGRQSGPRTASIQRLYAIPGVHAHCRRKLVKAVTKARPAARCQAACNSCTRDGENGLETTDQPSWYFRWAWWLSRRYGFSRDDEPASRVWVLRRLLAGPIPLSGYCGKARRSVMAAVRDLRPAFASAGEDRTSWSVPAPPGVHGVAQQLPSRTELSDFDFSGLRAR